MDHHELRHQCGEVLQLLVFWLRLLLWRQLLLLRLMLLMWEQLLRLLVRFGATTNGRHSSGGAQRRRVAYGVAKSCPGSETSEHLASCGVIRVASDTIAGFHSRRKGFLVSRGWEGVSIVSCNPHSFLISSTQRI